MSYFGHEFVMGAQGGHGLGAFKARRGPRISSNVEAAEAPRSCTSSLSTAVAEASLRTAILLSENAKLGLRTSVSTSCCLPGSSVPTGPSVRSCSGQDGCLPQNKDPEAIPKCAAASKEVHATAGRWPDVSALPEPTRRPLRPEMPLGCAGGIFEAEAGKTTTKHVEAKAPMCC